MTGAERQTRPADRRVRLEDFVARCGVSVSTVSRALAGEKGVRPALRELVMQAAREANYAIPSRVAGSRVIVAASSAAMIDYVRSQFTLRRARRAEARLAERSASSSSSAPSPARPMRLRCWRRLWPMPAVVGLLLLTLDDEDMLVPTRDLAKPIVLLNGDDPPMRLSGVTSSNR